MLANYVVIDIEASSFGKKSYPIEFAWGNHAIGIDSFLINPATLGIWDYWSNESEKIHNISRSVLLTDGIDPVLAWTRISELFTIYRVYSDKPKYDAGWLKAFSALNVDTSIVRVHDSGDIIRRNLDNQYLYHISVDEVYARASNVTPPTHRASADVAYLLKAIELSENMASVL